MPLKRLLECLDKNKVRFETIAHEPAYTAQEIAATAHIPGKEVAKTVMLKIDGKLAMAVIPATEWVNLDLMKSTCRADEVELASEDDFRDVFDDCEPGAMPPFGNLWGVDVYVSDTLAEDENIAFNAGSHSEMMRIPYADFERIVNPRVVFCSCAS